MSNLTWFHAISGSEAAGSAPVDQPGTLVHGATRRRGGGVDIAAVVSDPDGIATIDVATIRSTDGRNADIAGAWVRRDANSLTHTDDRPNNRWRTATMSVTYTDGNGAQMVLTATWDV